MTTKMPTAVRAEFKWTEPASFPMFCPFVSNEWVSSVLLSASSTPKLSRTFPVVRMCPKQITSCWVLHVRKDNCGKYSDMFFSNINLASFVKIASSSFSDVLLLQWRLQTVNKSASFTSYYSQVTWTWMWLPWLCQATLTKSRPCGERCAALWGCSWRTPTSASCLPFSPVSLEPTMACWYWISLISRTFER